MELIGPLQPELPIPVTVPKEWLIIVLALKNSFYTVSLHPRDYKRFAFSVPSLIWANEKISLKTCAPRNGKEPTLCQKFVVTAVKRAPEWFPSDFIIYYMYDILLSDKNNEIQGDLLAEVKI